MLEQQELDHVVEAFPQLCELAMENGEITDDELIKLGFSVDKDMHGNEVTRDAGTSQEPCQRAKKLLQAAPMLPLLQATLDHFAKPTVRLLSAYCCVCVPQKTNFSVMQFYFVAAV